MQAASKFIPVHCTWVSSPVLSADGKSRLREEALPQLCRSGPGLCLNIHKRVPLSICLCSEQTLFLWTVHMRSGEWHTASVSCAGAGAGHSQEPSTGVCAVFFSPITNLQPLGMGSGLGLLPPTSLPPLDMCSQAQGGRRGK